MTCTVISTGEELAYIYQNEEEQPVSGIKKRLFVLLQVLIAEGCDSFYVNCDLGIPLWAAEMLLSLRKLNPIQLHIVMPYEEQAGNWSEYHRDRYFAVHEAADSVEMVKAQYCDECAENALRTMIDKSDLLIICGQMDDNSEILSYAKQQGVRVGSVSLMHNP